MPPIWTCPRGHQWENMSSADSAACPVCGAVPVGPLVKPNLAPGHDPESLAETRRHDGDRDILPFGLAEAPARNVPPTKKNPLNMRPAPVKGNLDDTLLPTKMVRPPADEQMDETILRPMPVPKPPLPAAEPPPAPTAKGCWATASALILAAAALTATALAAAH